MSQQQSPDNVTIDEIPVDIDTTQSAEVDSADVPDEIESITRGLAGEQPPTNPLVVLKAARWWVLPTPDDSTVRSVGVVEIDCRENVRANHFHFGWPRFKCAGAHTKIDGNACCD